MKGDFSKTTTMRCPYCGQTFKISQYQMNNNSRFKCPHCHKYNEGSISAEPDGTLIGMTKEELRRNNYA